MKALIKDGTVVDIALETFEVHPDLTWEDCPDDCVAGWEFANGIFTLPPVIIEPVITMTEQEQKIEAIWNSIAGQDNTKLNELKLKLSEDAK